MPKAYIKIRQEKCKSCSLCVISCPQNLIRISVNHINPLGYAPAEFVDPDGECKGCKMCAEICPDLCILVYREKKLKA